MSLYSQNKLRNLHEIFSSVFNLDDKCAAFYFLKNLFSSGNSVAMIFGKADRAFSIARHTYFSGFIFYILICGPSQST